MLVVPARSRTCVSSSDPHYWGEGAGGGAGGVGKDSRRLWYCTSDSARIPGAAERQPSRYSACLSLPLFLKWFWQGRVRDWIL